MADRSIAKFYLLILLSNFWTQYTNRLRVLTYFSIRLLFNLNSYIWITCFFGELFDTMVYWRYKKINYASAHSIKMASIVHLSTEATLDTLNIQEVNLVYAAVRFVLIYSLYLMATPCYCCQLAARMAAEVSNQIKFNFKHSTKHTSYQLTRSS